MSNYPKDFSDERLREVARQWDDDGADGETVHALTREVIRLRAAMRADGDRLRAAAYDLPKHITMAIEHNPHAGRYQTVAAYLENHNDPDFIDEADRAKCLEENEMWIMTWYPDNPIGSYQLAASTLEKVLTQAKED